jgi:hypothetical protein
MIYSTAGPGIRKKAIAATENAMRVELAGIRGGYSGCHAVFGE